METNEVHMIPADADIDTILKVGREYSKGKSVSEIAMLAGVSKRDVKLHYEQYRQLMLATAKSNSGLADRLNLALEEVLDHYNMLIRDAWENKEEAAANLEFSVVNSSLKLIKDLQESKFKMTQAVTDGQDVELLADLEEAEERHEELMRILMELKDQFPDAAKFVRKRLNDVRGVQIV